MQSPKERRGKIGERFPVRFSTIFAAVTLACAGSAIVSSAQTKPLFEEIADAIASQQQNGGVAAEWQDRESGLRAEGMQEAWYNSADGRYFRYVQDAVDAALSGPPEAAGDAMSDDLRGRSLLLMYRVTRDEKYFHAAEDLETKLAAACRIGSPEGGPEKQPCRSEAFLAEYAAVFPDPAAFGGITRAYLSWDEACCRQPKGSMSEMAPLAASLVDSISEYSPSDPGREQVVALLRRIADAVAQRQDARAGRIYEQPVGSSNHGKELSMTDASLLVYALMKGIRLGYLPARDENAARRTWRGIVDRHAAPGEQEKGAFLLAADEMEQAPKHTEARGLTVLLDAWYNSQQRRNPNGRMESFHYKWDDLSDSGYSLFGHMLQSVGAETETLYSAPTREGLIKADYYIIVSPDIPKKNPNPHYMTEADAAVIAEWVNQGGVLVLMENDPPNADIEHLNLLSDRFGIHFDDVLHHHIIGEKVEDGRIPAAGDGPLFHRDHVLYMKDTCAISLTGTATALLRDRGDVVMAPARYGRGTVFAAVDPWLYNEYTDGRKNPAVYSQFDNFAAGKELVEWLIAQHSPKAAPVPHERITQ